MRDADVVDYLSACHHKTAYRTREEARRSLNNSVRAGLRVPKGMRLDTFVCRHPEGVVYHVGSTEKRRQVRRKYR
jgi:hypothetical protein